MGDYFCQLGLGNPRSTSSMNKQQHKVSFGSTCLLLCRPSLQRVNKMESGIIPGEGEETKQFNIFRVMNEAANHLKAFLDISKSDYNLENERDVRVAALLQLAQLESENREDHLKSAEGQIRNEHLDEANGEIPKTTVECPSPEECPPNMHALRNEHVYFKICDDLPNAAKAAEKFIKFSKDPLCLLRQKIAYADLVYLITKPSQPSNFCRSLELYDECESETNFSAQLQPEERLDCWTMHSSLLVKAVHYSDKGDEIKIGYAEKAVSIMIRIWEAKDVNERAKKKFQGRMWIDLAELQTRYQYKRGDLKKIFGSFREETKMKDISIESCEEMAMKNLEGRDQDYARYRFGKIYLAEARRAPSYEEWKWLLIEAESNLMEKSWHKNAASSLCTISIMHCVDFHYTKNEENEKRRYRAYNPQHRESEIGKHGLFYSLISSMPDNISI